MSTRVHDAVQRAGLDAVCEMVVPVNADDVGAGAQDRTHGAVTSTRRCLA